MECETKHKNEKKNKITKWKRRTSDEENETRNQTETEIRNEYATVSKF